MKGVETINVGRRHGTRALNLEFVGSMTDNASAELARFRRPARRVTGPNGMAFTETYGRIDRIVTTNEEGATTSVSKNVQSMRRAKSGKATERKPVRPGAMPTLFGRHMIGSSMFTTLGNWRRNCCHRDGRRS